MSDLSTFYIAARQQRERALDAQAGQEALAQAGYGATTQSEQSADGAVNVNTDVNAIDTSKVPAAGLERGGLQQVPRTGPAPQPQGALKLQNAPQPSRSRTG